MPDNGTKDLRGSIASLYLSKDYSDMKIICGTKVFEAHRNIVCTRSPYFKSAYNGDFREASGTFEFPEQNPAVFEKVLEFLYMDDYTLDNDQFHENVLPCIRNIFPDIDQVNQTAYNAPHFHFLVYIQADYFQIDNLKLKAKQYFLDTFRPSSLDTESLEALIVDIYDQTADDDKLRTDVTRLVMDALRTNKDIVCRKLLKLVPAFAADLCLATIDRQRQYGWY